MKFNSYREFQHYLHELSIALATSLDTMQTTAVRRFTVPAQVKASLDQDVKNLASFTSSIDARRITSVVRHLYAAKRIVLIAGDLAVNLVRFLEHHLNVLGLPVSSAISPGEIVHKMRHVGDKDVVLAVSFRRGLRPTVEGLRQAHANNAYCVVVTDSLLSPMAELADECFLTMVETPSFGASYVAPIALFNAIVVACSNFRRSHTLALLKKVVEEQKHGSRWYEL
jgi:DNA-binding MurR/RpiR family transcriptional regulator